MQTTTLCKKMLKAAVIMFRGLPSTSSKLGLIHSRTRAPVPLEVNGFCTLPTSFTRPKITPTYQNPSKIHPKYIQNINSVDPPVSSKVASWKIPEANGGVSWSFHPYLSTSIRFRRATRIRHGGMAAGGI